ncbi:ribulose-phosphate 3-epimerase [Candidatus Wolfebacteria bacterium]|nr:ribulose-phosphate 3-epimerase [Candidatus Wolfebacteria bacterium]
MKIIPAINCPDFDCVKEKLEKAAEFSDWAQIDVADGKFTPHKTWNNLEDILNLKSAFARSKSQEGPILNLNLEIHLMTENPQDAIDDWFKAGAKRIIVHLEVVQDLELFKNKNLKPCEIGLAINPETPVEKLVPYLGDIKFIQALAVNPGLSGQKFQPSVLEKIKFLKKNYPDVIIEVDGGINLETAKLCKEAGADILVSGSYVWNSENKKKTFEELSAV